VNKLKTIVLIFKLPKLREKPLYPKKILKQRTGKCPAKNQKSLISSEFHEQPLSVW
jgi:hypothetical protein